MMIGGPGAKGGQQQQGWRPQQRPQFYLPADITVDPTDSRMYVSDGYGNRRVVIVDAATGNASGISAPTETARSTTRPPRAGIWMNDLTKGNMKPAFFRTPVHCVRSARRG